MMRQQTTKGRWHSPRPFVVSSDFKGAIYEVTSHQFLLISLKIKNARPFSSSRSHSSLIPICLPFVENSLCASSTSSGVATFSVKRFAADKYSRWVVGNTTMYQGVSGCLI